MQVFDASSMIYAWDNYPLRQFPGLWEWIERQITVGEIAMPAVALEEVRNKVPDCAQWLNSNNLTQLGINNEMVQDAMRVKRMLGIIDDDYHPNGVGENDLLIIAVARAYQAELVSEERQPTLLTVLSKRKIPTVCSMNGVDVICISFIEYIKRSDEVFR